MLISDPLAVARGRWATDSQAWATPGKKEELPNLMNREWGGKFPAQNQSAVIVTRGTRGKLVSMQPTPPLCLQRRKQRVEQLTQSNAGSSAEQNSHPVSSLAATLVQGWASEEDPRQWRSGSLWEGLKVWGCDSGWSSKRGRDLGRRQRPDHPGGASSGWRWR